MQRPLSAGNIVIELSLRRAFRAQTSSFVKFELGTLALKILVLIRVRSSSAVFSSNEPRQMADTLTEIILVTGTFIVDTVKFKPFRRSCFSD